MWEDWRSRARAWRWRADQRIRRGHHRRVTERIHREMDVEENARVGLPADEQIAWPCFWVAELYAPSHAKALAKGLTELERGTSSLFAHPEEPSDWLSRARSWSGGFWRVGRFVNDQQATFRRQKVGLPDHFKSVHAELRQIAPGITVLLMRFVLTDAASASLNGVMKKAFSTKVMAIRGQPGGQTIRGPEHRKQDEVALVRSTYRDDARSWISRKVPGLFSAIPEAKAPTWDLLLSKSHQLYDDQADYDERWRECLGFGHALDQWQAASLPGLRFFRPGSAQAGASPSLVGLESEALAMLEGEHMGSDISGLLQLVDRRVSDQLVIWTLLAALDAHEDQFTSIRDELAAPPGWWQSGIRLRQLRREVMPLAFDLETLGNAAQNEKALEPWVRQSNTEFGLVMPEGKQPGPNAPDSLLHFIQGRIRERGNQIVVQGREISDALRTQGELLLATSNIRLQWIVLAFTVAVGAAGIYATLSAN